MSVQERVRLVVLSQVASGALPLVSAAETLGLSYRQARRVYRRWRLEGDSGLAHRLRGRAGNRAVAPAVRQQAVSLYREHYSDFGCTLACEQLAECHGLVVDAQTLRRWLMEAKLWRRRRRSPVKRRRRARRPCFGELVQIDGSHHDWFEGRRSPCVLMVMIDDATGRVLARFFESETTTAAMTMLRQWSLAHGLPVELYPDQASIYRVNTKSADEQADRTGKRPLTQFGRAMAELGVKLTCAKSPQAKGRVERCNGTLQDRLAKAMRLAGLSDITAANDYLESVFLPQFNAKFAVPAADEADVHRLVSSSELELALCVKEQRVVGQDHCVSWQGQVLQLRPGRTMASLAGKQVTVCQALDGTLSVHWRKQVVACGALAERPVAAPVRVPLAQRVAGQAAATKPKADHPWRGQPPSPAGRRPRSGAGSAPGSAAPRPALRQPQNAA